MLGHSSLFSQLLLLVNRHQFAQRVKECRAEKAAKGFTCWSQFVAMMFCQLAQAKSLREISNGLGCCEGKLNHLGLAEGPKRSTLSFANAKGPWQVFEQVFYDQLGLAQSLAAKKRLRFKNKLLSLDASVIDLSLSMFNWATFRQTKGAVKLHLLSGSRRLSAGLRSSERRKGPRDGGGQELEFCQGHRCGHGSGLYRLQTLRALDQSRDLLRDPTQREPQLLELQRLPATQEGHFPEGSVDPA